MNGWIKLKIMGLRIFVLPVVLSLIYGCSKKTAEDNTVFVAKIGDLGITARDFQLNYEFGFSHLKQGTTVAERKKSYLNWMINEKILAAEGYRKGLGQSEYVKTNERFLTDDLLIETLLEKEVKSGIQVSDEEIRQAVNKSKVQFKFRYWPAPSNDEAQGIYKLMKENGYSAVVDNILVNNPEINLSINDFTTDYLTWLEVPDEVMGAIKDLERGEISQPVKINNTYMIFQLLDFRREAVTENEYLSKAPSLKKILFHKKYKQAIVSYVDNLMTPQNVVTKGETFKLIADALTEWKNHFDTEKQTFRECIGQATEEYKAMNVLRLNPDKVLSTFAGGSLTVSELINGMSDVHFYEIVNPENSINPALNSQIALFIRNQFLVRTALNAGLERSPGIVKELSGWRDKWVYEQMITNLMNSEQGKLSQARLDEILQSLHTKYPVSINESVLDTITVNESESSRWAGMMILKGGTNRPVVPVTDPRWINVN